MAWYQWLGIVAVFAVPFALVVWGMGLSSHGDRERGENDGIG